MHELPILFSRNPSIFSLTYEISLHIQVERTDRVKHKLIPHQRNRTISLHYVGERIFHISRVHIHNILCIKIDRSIKKTKGWHESQSFHYSHRFYFLLKSLAHIPNVMHVQATNAEKGTTLSRDIQDVHFRPDIP